MYQVDILEARETSPSSAVWGTRAVSDTPKLRRQTLRILRLTGISRSAGLNDNSANLTGTAGNSTNAY